MSGDAFTYSRADDLAGALAAGAAPGASFLAGGTDLTPLWKARAARPSHVVDISRLPLAAIEASDEGLVLGALAKLSDVAADPVVLRDFPLVAEAIRASASGQVRNMASVGGALLQRTRCAYFRDAAMACNKREPGTGCPAREGESRGHAIFGASQACCATHPSDLAVALAALDAQVRIAGDGSERSLALADLHRLPGEAPQFDTVLAHGEIVTRIDVPRRTGWRTTYLKVRDRASFEFAVVSIAAALCVEDGRITGARLCAGGVAPKPWRLPAAETSLAGRAPSDEAFAEAADLAVQGAAPLAQNGFKIDLLRRAVARALATVGGAA